MCSEKYLFPLNSAIKSYLSSKISPYYYCFCTACSSTGGVKGGVGLLNWKVGVETPLDYELESDFGLDFSELVFSPKKNVIEIFSSNYLN